jgi:hypothetical protein
MNYSKLFFLPLFLATMCASGVEIPLLSSESIDKKAVAIQSKITRDRYLAYAAGTIVAARAVYSLSPYWSPLQRFFGETPAVHNIPVIDKVADLSVPQEASVTPDISWGQWFGDGLSAVKQNMTIENALKFTKDSLFSIGHYGLATCAQNGIGLVMAGMYKRLMYPDTLRWYVHTHVPYKMIIKGMKDGLVDPSLDSLDIAYNKQKLHDSCFLLACYGESMCAYMTYKTKKLDAQVQPIAELAKNRFLGFYNDWLRRMMSQLDQEIINNDEVIKLIQLYEKELTYRLRHFAILEGETEDQMCAIEERIDVSVSSQAARLF